MKRDPRVDPQAGDWTVTRKKSLERDWFWLVIRRTSGEVEYKDDKGRISTTDLESWQQGSENDEVLHVAGA